MVCTEHEKKSYNYVMIISAKKIWIITHLGKVKTQNSYYFFVTCKIMLFSLVSLEKVQFVRAK